MIEEDLFVELAEISGRTFHVLKCVAEHVDADDFSCLTTELESFERYLELVLPSLLEMTNDIRTIRAIESTVIVRARDQHGPQLGPTEERATAWRAELWELLGVFEVRGHQFTVPKVSELC